MAVHFEKPFKGESITTMTTAVAGDNGTKLTWSMVGENNYPMNFMNLFMQGMLEKDMSESLVRLKGILQNQ